MHGGHIESLSGGRLVSFRRETICDALAQTEWRNFVSKFFSSPQMHTRWQHHIPHIPGGGVCDFWCWVQICSQKFFPLPSTLDLEFSQGGGGGVRDFWCWVQICSQNFFPLPSALDLEFSQGGGGSVIFDAESKSVVKNFSLYQALWT